MAADVGRGLPRDHLSDLPDAILVSILSLLAIDAAARCSVLASPWRRLFPLTLLDFDICFPAGRHGGIDAVNAILAAHPTAPVRSFRTSYRGIDADEDSSGGGWLHELSRRGVQELVLSFRERRQRIPDSLFACADLTRIRATNCTFPDIRDAAAGAPALSRLTEIDLWDVAIPEGSLHALLSQCTALERLRMRNMRESGRIHIRSPSLKILSSDGHFGGLFIEDAPSLEWVLGDNMYLRGAHLTVAHAPKLEFLGYLGMGSTAIEIGETIFKEDQILVKTMMPSLKTLAVELKHRSTGYVNWLMQLLELFPCLETLYIRSEIGPMNQAAAPQSWNVLRSVPCVGNHLEKVVFEVYRGHEWQRDLAKFLHRRSGFLKAMEFHCMDDPRTGFISSPPSEQWVRKQQKLLCLDTRASMDAGFLFFKHHLPSNHHDICRHHYRDISLRKWYERNYYNNLYEV